MLQILRGRYGWIIWTVVVWGLAKALSGPFPKDWYLSLRTQYPPLWIPPNHVFGVIWGVLYIMIALCGWRLWSMDPSVPQVQSWRRLFTAQMLLNWSWMPVFFYFRALGLALVILVAMDILVWRLIIQSYRSSPITAWLLVPYGCWLLCATYFNAHFWWAVLQG